MMHQRKSLLNWTEFFCVFKLRANKINQRAFVIQGYAISSFTSYEHVHTCKFAFITQKYISIYLSQENLFENGCIYIYIYIYIYSTLSTLHLLVVSRLLPPCHTEPGFKTLRSFVDLSVT